MVKCSSLGHGRIKPKIKVASSTLSVIGLKEGLKVGRILFLGCVCGREPGPPGGLEKIFLEKESLEKKIRRVFTICPGNLSREACFSA